MVGLVFDLYNDPGYNAGPIDLSDLSKELTGYGRIIHTSITGQKMKLNEKISDTAIEKMAEEIQKFVESGKLCIHDVGLLAREGLDQRAIDFWEKKYNSGNTSSTGMNCCKCGELSPYADAPNQSDGSFKCYRCRI